MVTCDAEQRTEHDDMLPFLLTDSEGQTDLHSKHEVSCLRGVHVCLTCHHASALQALEFVLRSRAVIVRVRVGAYRISRQRSLKCWKLLLGSMHMARW